MNTCSVREKAQDKVFSLLGRVAAAEAGSGPMS
jgi:tRNA A37 methylthiotransferase MiaB